ncbi:hypothetical protein HanPSC8_Chr14g0606301 [Helianthus annuus]|nr:hypothetical protein HanPSC8_Chr14g0606301 [Helianthus annuus]
MRMMVFDLVGVNYRSDHRHFIIIGSGRAEPMGENEPLLKIIAAVAALLLAGPEELQNDHRLLASLSLSHLLLAALSRDILMHPKHGIHKLNKYGTARTTG